MLRALTLRISAEPLRTHLEEGTFFQYDEGFFTGSRAGDNERSTGTFDGRADDECIGLAAGLRTAGWILLHGMAE